MKLYIKYMVSIRCKILVKEELEKLNLHVLSVGLGEVEIEGKITDAQKALLAEALLSSGLVLIDDKKSILIDKIKGVIIEMVHYIDEPLKMNFSDYLSEKLHYDYTYMSNLFSEVKGITIEHFIIHHKIEHIKELLMYDELSVTEIAWKMNYSSVAHLSNQFKKETGFCPSHFKQLKDKRRGFIEEVDKVY